MKAVFKGYNPDNAANFLYIPTLELVKQEALAYAKANKLTPSASDKHKLCVLAIDQQRDFCHPEGTLYVGGRSGTGAIDDSRRFAEFLYANVDKITKTIFTLDTHFPWQIFFSNFWVTRSGTELDPHTMIDTREEKGRTILVNIDATGKILNSDVIPNPRIARELGPKITPAWLHSQCIHYCNELKNPANGREKKMLYLWPLHCMIGSMGHTIVGIIDEARQFHAFARASQPVIEIKGGNPLTENYSIAQPEVLTRFDNPTTPLGERNVSFLKHILDNDVIVIAGQAASHCVASSIDDILTEILAKDPELAKKVYIMIDCTSSVAVPDGNGGFFADFTPQAEAAFDRFEKAGMNVVKSTDPLSSWPGVAGALYA